MSARRGGDTDPDVSDVADLLARATALTAEGRGEEAIEVYDLAAARARESDDVDSWSTALLGLASGQRFETEVSTLPARLYELYTRVHDQPRRRAAVAAALARCWAYANVAERGLPYATLAVDLARELGDAALLVDALDAALAVHWGPDDLTRRTELARDIDAQVAYLTDTDAHLTAHLWALTVACERLDIPQMHRQIRALEMLAETSDRARFFAASRRLMLDLLRGRTDTAATLRSQFVAAAQRTFIPDAFAVTHALTAYPAMISGDRATCRTELDAYEEFGLSEGVITVLAEGAFLAAASGDRERTRRMLGHVSGDLSTLPRDHDWLLTLQCVLEAALTIDDRDTIEAVTELLSPYEGRAVINAGAVMFHGVTDDPLSRAHRRLGNAEAAHALRESAIATYRRIGAQWWSRRLANTDETPSATTEFVLRPDGSQVWEVGPADAPSPIRAMRGLEHLRRLVAQPGVEFTATDLIGAAVGGAVTQSGLDMLDDEARTAYRRRLTEIDELLDDAAPGDASRLNLERDALIRELRSATGLSGRERTTGATAERARVTVRKSIVGALSRIAEVHPDLARHLLECVHTGSTCVYTPDIAVRWLT
ncbi:hypothetical protein AAFP30_01255 [Gordonia sp. CPCC 205515]|uniref:hypothetical protein n=1 Tax=Gordonia sp. CPCC 205515 TaxID=3140791 RepID=UPI003AF352FE